MNDNQKIAPYRNTMFSKMKIKPKGNQL